MKLFSAVIAAKRLKRGAFGVLVFVGVLLRLGAYEFSFRVAPSFFVPTLYSGGAKYNALGGSIFFDTGFQFADFLTVGAEFGALFIPKSNFNNLPQGTDKLVTLFPVGLQVGAFAFPFSRLELGCTIAGGAGAAMSGKKTHYAPWYRASAEAALRISPAVSIAATGGWFNFQNDTWFGNPGVAGVTAGLSFNFRLDAAKSSGNVFCKINQDGGIFPLLYQAYAAAPAGTVSVHNDENAEIRNVRVRFRAAGYTGSAYECGRARLIHKHRAETFELYADFTDALLQFSENGEILGEIIVDYELLGERRTTVHQAPLSVYNRNRMQWTDPAAIAGFVSTSAPETLEFAKHLAGIAQSHLHSGLNANMQVALYLYEGLRLSDIQYAEDAKTPYRTYHRRPDLIDSIQYPFQTLLYKGGDADDLGILYMALLESVGIEAGFLPLDDDFIVCFSLNTDINKAAQFFNGLERVLSVNGTAWLPLSMKSLRDGFISSWHHAADELLDAAEQEADVSFTSLKDAWESYPPTGYASKTGVSEMPAAAAVTAAAERSIARYIKEEFEPQIAEARKQLELYGDDERKLNALGLLYVRAGMYADAISVFERAASHGSVSAMNNLGNIAMLQKRYADAQNWYRQALLRDPTNTAAQRGLERATAERGE